MPEHIQVARFSEVLITASPIDLGVSEAVNSKSLS